MAADDVPNGVQGGRGIGGMIEALRSKYGLEKGGQYLVVGESGGPGGLWKLEGGRTVPKTHLKEGGWRWVCDALQDDKKKRKLNAQDGDGKKRTKSVRNGAREKSKGTKKMKKEKNQDKDKKDEKRGRENSHERKEKKEKKERRGDKEKPNKKQKKDNKEGEEESSNEDREKEGEREQRIHDGGRDSSSSSSSSSSSDSDSSSGASASHSCSDRRRTSQQRHKRRRSSSRAPSTRSASSRSVRRDGPKVEVDELGRVRRPRSERSVSSASDSRQSEHNGRRTASPVASSRLDAALLRGLTPNGSAVAPASGGDGFQGEDPLDAYMAGIASQAKRDLSQVKRKAKAPHVDPARRRR